MEVSFAADAQPATDIQATAVVQPPTPTAGTAPAQTAPTPTAALATTQSPGLPAPASSLLLGDKLPDFKDIILPRVNIVQNIGTLNETFESGLLLLNQNQNQVVLFMPPGDIDPKTKLAKRPALPPVNMTVLGFRPTRYTEKVEGAARGMLVNTEQEVRANGGTLDYAEWKLKKSSGMRYFQPLADAVVVIRRPDSVADDDTVFSYEVDGAKYVLALWAMKGTAYTAGAKVFFTARLCGCLRQQGYPSWNYAITTFEKPYQGGNKAWVPVCIPVAKNTPAFLDFVRSIIGG